MIYTGENFDVISDINVYESVFIKNRKSIIFLTCILLVHVRKKGGKIYDSSRVYGAVGSEIS